MIEHLKYKTVQVFSVGSLLPYVLLFTLIAVGSGCAVKDTIRYPDPASNRAITHTQDDANTFYNRGIAYSDQGLHDRAIQDYDKAIELKPDFADAYNNRGNAYADKGAYDRAIQDYDKAIELKPDFADAYNNRGNAYADKGAYDRAIQDYDKAIELKAEPCRGLLQPWLCL